MRTARRLTSVVGAALVGLALPAICLGAPTDNPGKAAYLKYCSACHGQEGKGDGPVSGLMTPRPTDLTQLGTKKDFPTMRIADAIDGTKSTRAHGDPFMPVWGELFREQAGSENYKQAEVRGKVLLITDYLRSIQVK